MAIEFAFPDVGEGIHEGKLVEWLVKEGDPIAVDQPFVRVETDKAIVELPSPRKGTVLKRHFSPGETVRVGSVLITFGEAGETVTPPSAAPTPASSPVTPLPSSASEPPAEPMKRPEGAVLATPHTRALARRLGIDITTVTPSGKGGRITDDDVERAKSHPRISAPPLDSAATPSSQHLASDVPASPTPRSIDSGEPVERIPVTHLRKIIAQNMIHSKQTSAHVTHVDEADVTELYTLYKKIKSRMVLTNEAVKFTILPFFIKAAVIGLKGHPYLNATYDEHHQEILLKKFYHIGIATDTPDGLMVPVLRHADQKDMIALAQEIETLAQKARERRISLDDLRGSTFTITNVGPTGGVFATPIIHQPELAILGLHAIKDRPAVVNGEILPRKRMYLSLSFDHRIIDGLEAARFMSGLVELIENPDLLMMRLV